MKLKQQWTSITFTENPYRFEKCKINFYFPQASWTSKTIWHQTYDMIMFRTWRHICSWKWSNLGRIKPNNKNNNFFYSQVASFSIPGNINAFFFFFFSKSLISFSSLFSVFYVFLLQKDSDNFHVLLLGVCFCVFDNNYLPFLYIQKNYKKYFSYIL